MTKLSDHEIEKIIQSYQKGEKSTLILAKENGVSQWTIYYRIKTYVSNPFKISISKNKIQTEVRCCDCIGQQCKGRFLVKKDKSFTVCPYEAVRIGLITSIDEFYI